LAELDYALNKVSCKALVIAEEFKASNYVEMIQSLIPELLKSDATELHSARIPALRTIIKIGATATPGMLNFSDVIGNGRTLVNTKALDSREAQSDSSDPINIQFTSGTTERPKGANCMCIFRVSRQHTYFHLT
jgi:fatty-acyl-CoA synthase